LGLLVSKPVEVVPDVVLVIELGHTWSHFDRPGAIGTGSYFT